MRVSDVRFIVEAVESEHSEHDPVNRSCPFVGRLVERNLTSLGTILL